MMNLRKKLFFTTLSLLFLILISLFPMQTEASSTAKDESVTMKVPFPIMQGMAEISETGERTGLIVDYLNAISNYTGWKYEYYDIGTDSANEMLEDFMAGKYDLMGGTYYHEVLTEYYAYPNFHTGYSHAVLLARWDDESIKSYDLSSINGKKIGVYEKATTNIEYLKAFLTSKNVQCEIVEYTANDFQNDTLYHHLHNGDVDLLLGNTHEAGQTFKAVSYFQSQLYYIVTQAGNTEILDQLNYALEKIYETQPNFAEETYNKNFSNIISSNIKLTSTEKAFISSGKVVKIAVPRDLHPLYCDQTSQEHQGILFDIMSLIGEKTDLQYEFIEAMNYDDCYSMVENGTADVVGIFIDEDGYSDRKNDFALTSSYTDINMTLLKNKKVTYPSDGLKVGILSGTEIPRNVEAEVVEFPTIMEALQAANSGKIDLVYGMLPLMEKIIQEKYFTSLVSVSLSSSNASIRLAVSKPADSVLFTILNKSINMISDKEMSTIYNKNIVSIGNSEFSLLDFIYGNPILSVGIIGTFLLLTSAIVLVIALYRIRSANLRLKVERYSADSRAKSVFLSRMSHEIRTPMNAIIGLTDLTLMKKDIPEEVVENLGKISSSSKYLLSLLNDILDTSRIENQMLAITKEPFSLSTILNDIYSIMSGEAKRSSITFHLENTVTQDLFVGDSIRLKQVLANLVSNAIKFTPPGGNVNVTVCETDDKKIKFSVKDTGCGIKEEDKERIFSAFEQSGTGISKSKGTGLGLFISKSIVESMGGKIELVSTVGEGSDFFFIISLEATEEQPKPLPVRNNTVLDGMRILMAEDNDLNAEIAKEILVSAGAVITRAEDGQKALDIFIQNSEGFDAILMDIQMPNMNGLEATRRIRESNTLEGKTIPIIAMTANSFQEDIDSAKEAGMDHFLVKPIDINRLYSVLKDVRK